MKYWVCAFFEILINQRLAAGVADAGLEDDLHGRPRINAFSSWCRVPAMTLNLGPALQHQLARSECSGSVAK